MNKYIYKDHNQGSKVIFETVANNILEADKAYEKATGKNPVKQSFVGCEIKLGEIK